MTRFAILIGLLLFNANGAQGATPSVQTRSIIDAPMGVVWGVMTDYQNLDELTPGYQAGALISETRTQRIVDLKTKPSRLLPLFQYRLKFTEDAPNHRVKLERIAGDFRHLNGTYQLVAKGEQTEVVYHLTADPGTTVPAFAVGPLLKNQADQCVKRLKDLSQSNYRRSVIGHRPE
jgi:carbon monoxide dehydrogenase subunit G